MAKDIEIKITVNKDNGNFELVADDAGKMDLVMACAGLIKATATCLGKTEVDFLEKMILGAKQGLVTEVER